MCYSLCCISGLYGSSYIVALFDIVSPSLNAMSRFKQGRYAVMCVQHERPANKNVRGLPGRSRRARVTIQTSVSDLHIGACRDSY